MPCCLIFTASSGLVYENHLPPALVFGNPQFLRPCLRHHPPDGVHLHTYAADLARSPDGQWWVIADRTQAPAGMGYSLENRLVSARTLPTVFSQYRVRQLARFFDVRRDALLALAAKQKQQSARGGADARARTTTPILSTPFWRAIGASPWWKATT